MEEYLIISSQESCLGGEIIFGSTNVAFLTSDSSKPTKPPTERVICLSFPNYLTFHLDVKRLSSITRY